MRALLIRPGEQAEIITLYDAHDIQSQLNQIKEYVGGWFESLPAPLGHFLFVNEEARLIGLWSKLHFSGQGDLGLFEEIIEK